MHVDVHYALVRTELAGEIAFQHNNHLSQFMVSEEDFEISAIFLPSRRSPIVSELAQIEAAN